MIENKIQSKKLGDEKLEKLIEQIEKEYGITDEMMKTFSNNIEAIFLRSARIMSQSVDIPQPSDEERNELMKTINIMGISLDNVKFYIAVHSITTVLSAILSTAVMKCMNDGNDRDVCIDSMVEVLAYITTTVVSNLLSSIPETNKGYEGYLG